MMDLFFFIKTFILTIVLVLAMQIQVGPRTIENHAMSFVQSSVVVAPLNTIARGAAKLVRDVTQNVSARVKQNTKKNKKERSSCLFLL
ncbi:MAG: hypothetical protein HC883_03990 [Bdellovibrionaceae bacterium]|nr:hypothetical protein [Pseudobdellovibrionaceae bacterium]